VFRLYFLQKCYVKYNYFFVIIAIPLKFDIEAHFSRFIRDKIIFY